jgi:hypothetical protein
MDKKYNILKPIKIENLARVGRNADGGYVVDEDVVKNCNVLVSFGLGTDWSFELSYIKKNPNVEIHVYDNTVSSHPYIKQVAKYLKRFITFRANLLDLKARIKNLLDYLNFFRLKQITFFNEKISFPAKNNTEADMNRVFSRLPKDKKIVLKCDIEGSEFEIIKQINDYSDKIDMLIFEFHSLDINEKIFLDSIDLFKKNFHIVHLHGNNHCEKSLTGLPIILEMTFISKRFKKNASNYVTDFPIKNLDYPNNPYKSDLFFSFKD